MKKSNVTQQMVLGIIVIVFCIAASVASFIDLGTGMEVTNGLYGVTINVSPGGEEWTYDADSVVPDRETLISNLEQAGYQIELYDTALNSEIPAQRVLAIKGNHYIDICYGLTEEDAPAILTEYEYVYGYQKFYVLARNQEYVYCIGSKKAFKHSGFTELSNDGLMYLCK